MSEPRIASTRVVCSTRPGDTQFQCEALWVVVVQMESGIKYAWPQLDGLVVPMQTEPTPADVMVARDDALRAEVGRAARVRAADDWRRGFGWL